MTTPQGPGPSHNPADPPAWGQQPAGGWGAEPEAHPDDDRTQRVDPRAWQDAGPRTGDPGADEPTQRYGGPRHGAPPGAGPQGGAPQNGGPPRGGPQHAAPPGGAGQPYGTSPYGAAQPPGTQAYPPQPYDTPQPYDAPPQYGGPQPYGAPPYGGGQHAAPPYGSPPPGSPQQGGNAPYGGQPVAPPYPAPGYGAAPQPGQQEGWGHPAEPGWGQQPAAPPTQDWGNPPSAVDAQSWGQPDPGAGYPPPPDVAEPPRRSKLPLIIGLVVVLAIAIGAVLYFLQPAFLFKKVFDTAAVQAGVQKVLTDDYAIKGVSGVTCGQNIPVVVDTTFTCDATIDGQNVKVQSKITSADGNYEVARPT